MEPHGLSPWYLQKNTLLRPWAPKRSRLREARYSVAQEGRYAGAKASEGHPPVAKSAEAVIPRFKISTDTAHAFIVRRHRLWPTASTGRARGLLRRRMKGEMSDVS